MKQDPKIDGYYWVKYTNHWEIALWVTPKPPFFPGAHEETDGWSVFGKEYNGSSKNWGITDWTGPIECPDDSWTTY